MDSIFRMTILATFLIGILGFSSFVKSETNVKVDHICNGGTYDTTFDRTFVENLNFVLGALRDETPKVSGYNYYITSPFPNYPLAYGHATCDSTISFSDCDLCMSNARE
ncbi:hypothetical protein A4A49_53800 [Nicotiana attenuata]|uniref:Gnk2-homologous domain-containing protein n=1 Tax=Nicotiana attenuata TaxID=49451 RepID=A0A314KXP1_NICAT|nr:hypothetical protein A4A49_53800 [Nicotiana attenuata]